MQAQVSNTDATCEPLENFFCCSEFVDAWDGYFDEDYAKEVIWHDEVREMFLAQRPHESERSIEHCPYCNSPIVEE